MAAVLRDALGWWQCSGMPWGGGSAQRPWAKADEWQERNGQGSHKDNDMSSGSAEDAGVFQESWALSTVTDGLV